MRGTFLFLALAVTAAFGEDQDPCKLEFENAWVRVSRVSYPPFGKSKLHAHPALPTVYVYTTDSGPMRFRHDEGIMIERRPVKAGGLRFNRGMIETHEVESLSDFPTEYFRIELKTEPLELPRRDIRIAPEEDRGFENAQIRIEKLTCLVSEKCGATELPAVVVNINNRTATWIHNGLPVLENTTSQPFKLIRIAMKSSPRAPESAPGR